MKLRLTQHELLEFVQTHFSDQVSAVEIISPTITSEGQQLVKMVEAYEAGTKVGHHTKINTIKDVRTLCACGLREAKDFVEMRLDLAITLIERHGLDAPNHA